MRVETSRTRRGETRRTMSGETRRTERRETRRTRRGETKRTRRGGKRKTRPKFDGLYNISTVFIHFLSKNPKNVKKRYFWECSRGVNYLMWRFCFKKIDENIETLKYCEIHLLAAVWYMYACILQILNQHAKKNLPAVMGGQTS